VHHALIWLLVVEVLGLIAFPFAFSLFHRLPDRGLILSKLLGLLVSSYILWLLGLTHVAPNSRYTIIAILVVLALASALVLWRRWREIAAFLRREHTTLLMAELVFLGFYFLWLSVASNSPAINHTEKPMDFAFLNSILRSTYFPPEDPWLAGHPISYYYFGHFMMAFLTKLTAIPSSISYNLSIALIPALVGACAFSLAYNLIRLSGASVRAASSYALAAPLFLVLIGNLEGVLELIHAHGWGSEGFWQWVSIKGLDAQGSDSSLFPNEPWWWWRATRVIDTVMDGRSLDYTITEFPFFSFLLGDLHPHVSSLPFLILNLALGLNLLLSRERLGLSWLCHNPWEVFAIVLSLGALAFINIWDFPVFAALYLAVVLVRIYGDWNGQATLAIVASLSLLVPVLAGAVLLYTPFYLTLGSQASGILPLRDVSTRPLFFFLIWGLFLVLSGSFLLKQLWTAPNAGGKTLGIMAPVLVITLLPFLLWAGIELLISPFDDGIGEGVSSVGSRLGKLLPGLAVVGVALYSALLRAKRAGPEGSQKGEEMTTAFSLLALALAFYLLIGVELFYLVDFFGNRMNTVFKVYYQAWLLLAIVSAYGLYYCCSRPMLSSSPSPRPSVTPLPLGEGPGVRALVRLPLTLLGKTLRYGWIGLVVVLVLASLYYPLGAALDRAKYAGNGSSLDGLGFLRGNDSGEYEAIKWLRDEAPWGRVVEAVGDDYSEYGRISSSTGLPTLLGWKGHEHQWRGSTTPFLGREEQVAQIYRSNDPEQVRRLLDTYGVRYVYLGAREWAKYGGGQSFTAIRSRFEGFAPFLKPIFERKDVLIYERLQHSDEQEVIERDDGSAG